MFPKIAFTPLFASFLNLCSRVPLKYMPLFFCSPNPSGGPQTWTRRFVFSLCLFERRSWSLHWRLIKMIWAEHEKYNKMACAPNEDSDQPGHPPCLIKVFDCAHWEAEYPSFLHADSEDSDQTGRMPRLIWVFAGRTHILLVLSCRGSFWSV